jgi:preprotein translocase subunit SecE
MSTINPAKFIREVRQEMKRVSWASRKETWVSTLMVLFLVAFASLFFVVVDVIAGSVIRSIIGI